MNKKIYVGMTADIMHPGLIHIIHEATKYGDVIVGLLTDKAIAEHKRLPYLTYDQRKEVVENIKGFLRLFPRRTGAMFRIWKNSSLTISSTATTGKRARCARCANRFLR